MTVFALVVLCEFLWLIIHVFTACRENCFEFLLKKHTQAHKHKPSMHSVSGAINCFSGQKRKKKKEKENMHYQSVKGEWK